MLLRPLCRARSQVPLVLRQLRNVVMHKTNTALIPHFNRSALVAKNRYATVRDEDIDEDEEAEDVEGALFVQQPSKPAETPQHQLEFRLNVKAFHIARTINIDKFTDSLSSPDMWYKLEKNSVVIHLREAELQQRDLASSHQDRFVVVYNFGSIVFINCDEGKQLHYINKIKSPDFCEEILQKETTDDYTVVVVPELDTWSKSAKDYIMVRDLDIHNVAIVSEVLSRTVALHHYEARVTNLLTSFKELNMQIEQNAKFDREESKSLTKIVARNNIVITDLNLYVRLLDRPEISWRYAQYDEIFTQLKSEFELETRYRKLRERLEFIQNNTKFFMELLHNKTSTRAEYMIIGLIAFEVLLNIVPYLPK